MTTPQGTGTTSTADAPAGDLSARVGRIEAEQAAQRGLLEQIRDRLGGGQAPAAPAAGPAGPGGAPADPAAIIAQVRRELTEADQRRAAEQAETKWKDGVNQTLDKLKRERAPREPEAGVRAMVQRMLIGRQR
jgi:hypothetical protein